MKIADCGVSSIVADDAQKPVWSAHILSIWSREGDAKLTVRMGGGGGPITQPACAKMGK